MWLAMASVEALAATAPSDIVRYASDASNLHGNWSLAGDATAAGGTVLTSADLGWSATQAALAAPADYADFSFVAQAGQPYRLWIRMRARANSKWNDSIWAQFSDAVDSTGAPALRIGTPGALMFNLENCSGCGTSG
jgi:hypothetical protein